MKTSEISDPAFRQAIEAIDTGDIITLQNLLETNPELVTTRVDIPTEGYFARPFLLWFIADNPIRIEKLPLNITEITVTIIKVLQNYQHDSYQYQLDYTLELVCTGKIVKECKVQLSLMDLLIKEGAKVKGSVLGTIGEHNFEAAKYLLEKGCDYNLATAVAFERLDEVKNLIKKRRLLSVM